MRRQGGEEPAAPVAAWLPEHALKWLAAQHVEWEGQIPDLGQVVDEYTRAAPGSAQREEQNGLQHTHSEKACD